jgi:periplasmic copper chaperone A
MKTQLWKLFFAFAGVVLLADLALAGEPPVKITDAWIRAVPSSSSDTAAYMILTNESGKALRLTGGSTPIAQMVMPMVTTKKMVEGKEVMGMENVDSLIVPAGGRLTLSPGGDHLMLMTLKEHRKPGEKAKLTLHFEPGGGELTLELPVSMTQP